MTLGEGSIEKHKEIADLRERLAQVNAERKRLRRAFRVMVDAPAPDVVWLLGVARAALVERAYETDESEQIGEEGS